MRKVTLMVLLRQEEWERTRPPTEQERIEALESALLDLISQGGDM